MYATPRRRSTPLFKYRIRATEKVDEGEARRASKEIALVLEKCIAREMCANREEEDGEV
jgi:hypothetical protein